MLLLNVRHAHQIHLPAQAVTKPRPLAALASVLLSSPAPARTLSSGARISASASSSPPAAPRGMHDNLGSEAEKREHITNVFKATARSFGFKPIETPVVEETRLFARSLGEGSDVVSKEMYNVKGGGSLTEETASSSSSEDLTLRPEGTAGTMRALINSGLIRVPKAGTNSSAGAPMQPAQKLYYSGPMFRHERPQKGRFRQFTQLGIESVGGTAVPADNFLADVEVLHLAHTFLGRIFEKRPFKLLLNTLGDASSMQAYAAALKDYFTAVQNSATSPHKLSKVSASRLERGSVLRILDSKDEGDKAIIAAGAPCIDDHLSQEAKERIQAVTEALTSLGIAFERDYTLVRGLDYYRHTIFEFVHTATPVAIAEGSDHSRAREPVWGAARKGGAEPTASTGGTATSTPAVSAASSSSSTGVHLGTILAGGRYDGLAPIIGGGGAPGSFADVPAVGWAAGLERLCLLTAPDLHESGSHQPFTVAILPVVPKAGKGPSAGAMEAVQALATGANGNDPSASSSKAAVEAAIVSASLRLTSFLRSSAAADTTHHAGGAVATSSASNTVYLLGERTSDVKKAVQAASKSRANVAVILGEDELACGCVVVKNMDTGEQRKVGSTGDVTSTATGSPQQAPGLSLQNIRDAIFDIAGSTSASTTTTQGQRGEDKP